MASEIRQELVRNAVTFLSDPKTQASPVSQRIQFLEAKGLTPPEIDLALRQAAGAGGPPPAYSAPYAQNPYVMGPPPRQPWDWRDYFIVATVSGALTYGAVSLFKKYLLPHLQPPSTTAYEEDRDALNAQFDAAEALLKEIQSETAAMRTAVEDQKERIDRTTDDVKAAVSEMREAETRTRDEMREVREEINTIRDMLPKMIERNKESQTQSLNELQQELKSLKTLLLSRPPTVTGTPASPLPMLGRPSIPAWQLASPGSATSATNGTGAVESSTPASSAAPTIVPTPVVPNGKGKEPETSTPGGSGSS